VCGEVQVSSPRCLVLRRPRASKGTTGICSRSHRNKDNAPQIAAEKVKMEDDKDQELRDLARKRRTRGKKKPRKKLYRSRAVAKLPQLSRMLSDPRCDGETYLEAIRAIGLPEESDAFHQLLALWEEAPRIRLTTTRCADRMRLSCSSGVGLRDGPQTILVNSWLNSRRKIFFFVDFFFGLLAKIALPPRSH